MESGASPRCGSQKCGNAGGHREGAGGPWRRKSTLTHMSLHNVNAALARRVVPKTPPALRQTLTTSGAHAPSSVLPRTGHAGILDSSQVPFSTRDFWGLRGSPRWRAWGVPRRRAGGRRGAQPAGGVRQGYPPWLKEAAFELIEVVDLILGRGEAGA